VKPYVYNIEAKSWYLVLLTSLCIVCRKREKGVTEFWVQE